MFVGATAKALTQSSQCLNAMFAVGLEVGDAVCGEVGEVGCGEDGVEDFEAGDEAGAGAGEVGGAVYGEDLAVADGGEVVPFGWEGQGFELGEGLGEVVAAGHEDDNFGVGGGDFWPGDAAGFFAGGGEDGLAAGEGDHFGDPVAALEGRV